MTLTIKEGETHAIMGKNGSGKSTFTKVLVGHPSYEVTGGTASFRGQDLFAMEPEERARAGLFLSFQSPIEVPGVSNTDFLRMMCNERRKARGESGNPPPRRCRSSGRSAAVSRGRYDSGTALEKSHL